MRDNDFGKKFTRKIVSWGKNNRRSYPWRVDRDPFNVLVAEFFLQKTPAERVANFYSKFISLHPNFDSVAQIDSEEIEQISKILGLKSRVLRLIETSKIISKKFGNNVPNTYDCLIQLPGIGEYTASAILCFCYRKPVPLIDSNVIRVLTRYFNFPQSINAKDKKLKHVAKILLPCKRSLEYNEAILDFAALICKPRPLCSVCTLKKECNFFKLLKNR